MEKRKYVVTKEGLELTVSYKIVDKDKIAAYAKSMFDWDYLCDTLESAESYLKSLTDPFPFTGGIDTETLDFLYLMMEIIHFEKLVKEFKRDYDIMYTSNGEL